MNEQINESSQYANGILKSGADKAKDLAGKSKAFAKIGDAAEDTLLQAKDQLESMVDSRSLQSLFTTATDVADIAISFVKKYRYQILAVGAVACIAGGAYYLLQERSSEAREKTV